MADKKDLGLRRGEIGEPHKSREEKGEKLRDIFPEFLCNFQRRLL